MTPCFARVGHDDVGAREGRPPRRLELARHSSGADALLVDATHEREGVALDLADQDARALRASRSPATSERRTSEIRVDERRDHGAELVVVAEA